jgi:hypothetical protein
MAAAGNYSNFCANVVATWEGEDKRVVRFMADEISAPGGDQRYTGLLENARTALRIALKPILEQEGLWDLAQDFFGGEATGHTDYLLEEFAEYVADPESYVAPSSDGEDEDDDDEEDPNG